MTDTRPRADDRAGDLVDARIGTAGHTLADRAIVKDDVTAIVARLAAWIDDPMIDCVITTGGTGVTGRDVTPEAISQVRSEEHTSELQSLMRISYAVFCLKKKMQTASNILLGELTTRRLTYA